MNRRQYFQLCMQQPLTWLQQCADEPSSHMNARHVALIRLAIRHKSWKAA